jgi:hypothetical protein
MSCIATRQILRPERNAGFLKQFLEHFPQVTFAEQATAASTWRPQRVSRCGPIAPRWTRPLRTRKRARAFSP